MGLVSIEDFFPIAFVTIVLAMACWIKGVSLSDASTNLPATLLVVLVTGAWFMAAFFLWITIRNRRKAEIAANPANPANPDGLAEERL